MNEINFVPGDGLE